MADYRTGSLIGPTNPLAGAANGGNWDPNLNLYTRSTDGRNEFYDIGTNAWQPMMNTQAPSAGAEQPQALYSDKPTEDVPTNDGGSSTIDQAAITYFQNQIDQLNALLGNSPRNLETSLGTLGKNYDTQNTNLANQRTRTINDYGVQKTENAQDKQTGIEGVGSFVNNSYNSLMRLLSGAGAGNSSVARTVVPTLVSKAGSSRRAGVFDTAGRNEQAIISAQTDAENQFTDEQKSLDEWKRQQEGSLRNNAVNQDVSTLRDIQNAEYERASAGGEAASGDTQAKINERMAQLNSLFGTYQPTYTPKAMSLKAPEISKYTIDKGQIQSDQNIPAESSYYLPQILKKKQLTY